MKLTILFQAGPSECALVTSKDESPSGIRERLEDWLDDLFMNPMAVPNATMPSILTSGAASSEFHLVLMTYAMLKSNRICLQHSATPYVMAARCRGRRQSNVR